MKKLIPYLLILTSVSMSACVQIKDKDDDKNNDKETVVKTRALQNLTIDEPYYLVNGELLRQKDFVTQKEVNASRNVGDVIEYHLYFDHLTFKSGGIIYTMGQTLWMVVKDLESSGGVITTYPSNTVVAENTEGLSGGQVNLSVEHARGDLSVLIIGGQGGRGLKGAVGAANTVIANPISNMAICFPGAAGGAGKPGARGGLSGKAEISIRDDAGFAMNVVRRGGPGGPPGEGGEGGPNQGCAGHGLKGPPGSIGPEGLIQDVCIKKGEKPRQCI